jgi:hypothetical protein
MTRFEEVERNQGVDSLRPGSEWMMVPLHGSNMVCLTDGAGYSLKEEQRKKLKPIVELPANEVLGVLGAFFRKGTRVFRVTGTAGGETAIVATKGKSTARIAVSVHPKRPALKIAYFFLQDEDDQGGVQPRTAFPVSVAKDWTQALNDVFGPQSNLWFTTARADPLPIRNLNRVVGGADDVKTLAAHKDKAAEVNIFLAGPEIVSVERDFPLGFYDIQTNLIVVKDQFAKPWADPPAPMVKTLAHEIAHLLNYTHHSSTPGHDFYQTSGYRSDILNTLDGKDIKISRQRVLDWNPW